MSNFAKAGLTFAEAYEIQKSKEVKGKRSHKSGKSETIVTNITELDMMLQRTVTSLEEEPKLAVKNTKSVLKGIPAYLGKHVTTWRDKNNLDVLQHLIINNKPDLITFVLSETSFFPFGYVPTYNPYAHLAAILGHAECLKQILQLRPRSFFKSDKDIHAIKLPDAVMKRVKLNETPKLGLKGAGRLMQKIKFSTMDEERKMQTRSEEADIAVELDKELGAIDQSFQEAKKHLPKIPPRERRRTSVTKYKKTDEEKQSAQEGIARRTNLPPVRKAGNQPKHLCASDSGDSLSDHFKRRIKPLRCAPKRHRHLITVFWDALADLDPGIVSGAGAPISMKISPHAHSSRGIDLDRDDFHSQMGRVSVLKSRSPKSGEKPKATNLSKVAKSSSTLGFNSKQMKTIEMGVRSHKKYKEFRLSLQPHSPVEKDESSKYMNKTPLTYAAEQGHMDCVQIILDMIIMRRNPSIQSREPLSLATKARCPESILLLLDKKISRNDYQSAVMLAIREMYPDCLTALLSHKGKDRSQLFDGANLFHILYSQSVMSYKRYEFMPEMTRALISSNEDVNAHSLPRTYPMYTLISCAFNITVGKQIFYFIDCLNILLEHRANPHFDEDKQSKNVPRQEVFGRQSFTSAINCVFESAKNSTNYFESIYWSNLFMKKFITTIELEDRTGRRVLNNVFFDYMDAVCQLGLDKTIVRCLLRYGGNPDYKKGGKYAVNVYFDKLFPYLARFETSNYKRYHQELVTVMNLCRHMSLACVSEALHIFLSEHLLSVPLQALPISREFASKMSNHLRSPRPLGEMAAQAIWLKTRRNKKKVKALPISEEYIQLIIP